MKMRSFASYVNSTPLQKGTLKDCSIVIDAHGFFFRLYQESKCNFLFGCESENYASYLKEYLSMFKRANVRSYFVFKGGNENRDCFKDNYHHRDFTFGEFVPPMFVKEVNKEVLDAMGFDYTFCEFESKKECMALAQALNCAIVGENIEYCFSGIDYIHMNSLVFNEEKGGINCSIFRLKNFLSDNNLREEALSVLITLTDQNIFPDGYFANFMHSQKITTHYFKRFSELVAWLSKNSRSKALNAILKSVKPEESEKVLEEELKARRFIRPTVTPGLATFTLTQHCSLEIKEKHATWFEKGIIAKQIPMQYANLYHHGVVLGSWPMQDPDEDDAVILSLDMIKYAYNLMTNFCNDEINFKTREAGEKPISLQESILKPNQYVDDSVFEDGSREIKELRLFEHFLDETLPGFDVRPLEKLPEDVRLLIIALTYFDGKKAGETKNVAYSVLLSYLALTLLKRDGNQEDQKLDNNNEVDEKDVEKAAEKLNKYFAVNDDAESIFDVKLNHGLLEFQYCLQQMNFLNKICGSSFKNTIYSKTFNGTFVYRVLKTIEEEYDGNGVGFIEKELHQTGTVWAFFDNLVEVYHEVTK